MGWKVKFGLQRGLVLADKMWPRMNIPFVSKDGSVFMVLVGRPDADSYLSDLKLLEGAMKRARGKLRFPKGSTLHRRGQYPNLSTGISYGGGSKVSEPSPPPPEPLAHLPPAPWRPRTGQQE